MKELNELNKKQTIKLLKTKWNKTEYALNNKTWTKYGTDLLKANLEESKQHNNFRGDGIKRGLTVREEAIFFSVKTLYEYVYNLESFKLELKDYMHVRKSLYIAFALAEEFKEDLKKIVTKQEAEFFKTLDYVELIKGE